MKYLAILCLGLFGLNLPAAQQTSPSTMSAHDKGNGGGGIYRNGRYMTFYSAGFYTEPLEATSDEIPQLKELIHFFNTTPYLSELTKVKYAKALMRSKKRHFYKVKPESFTPEIRSRLIEEYGRITGAQKQEIALFAITDTNKGNTYVFPEYYSLSPVEQWAILFHEAYWIVNPDASYEQVVEAEISFQAYLENKKSAERLLRWIETVGTSGDVLKASIEHDLNNKTMKGLVSNESILFHKLVGKKWYQCHMNGGKSQCLAFISTHLYSLTQKYPDSVFIELLYSKAVDNKIRYAWSSFLAYSPRYSGNIFAQGAPANYCAGKKSIGSSIKVYLTSPGNNFTENSSILTSGTSERGEKKCSNTYYRLILE